MDWLKNNNKKRLLYGSLCAEYCKKIEFIGDIGTVQNYLRK